MLRFANDKCAQKYCWQVKVGWNCSLPTTVSSFRQKGLAHLATFLFSNKQLIAVSLFGC